MCTIRQLIVKLANKSRRSFQYVDKEELIIAHMDGGVDVFIKPPQGWPLSMSALKLVSLRSSDQNAKGISLSLLSKVEEAADSLDVDIRKSITDFVDGIEEILLEKMRADLH
uniref:RNA-directed DNA polymerase n=2 Tax=Opuntia streptacantha TaxID=393608 RepID=A0A7C9E967_OPUST